MRETPFQCRCGAVRLVAKGDPIVGVACDCSHCEAASRAFEALGAPGNADGWHGARAILFRNDRVQLVRGRDQLDQYRFGPSAPTRRLVARCCNTPMLLDYEAGFWLSVYRHRGDIGEHEVPSRKPGLGFIASLMRTYLALGFRVPPAPADLSDLPQRELTAPARPS